VWVFKLLREAENFEFEMWSYTCGCRTYVRCCTRAAAVKLVKGCNPVT